MPAAGKNGSRGKRALDEVDANKSTSAPNAKKSKSKQSNEEPATENTENVQSDKANDAKSKTLRDAIQNAKRVSELPPRQKYGPNGELFLPKPLPLEAVESKAALKIFPKYFGGADGIPGRPMTTGNEKWWAENMDWLKQNAKAIKFDEKKWREVASKTGAKLSGKDKEAETKADRDQLEHGKKVGYEDFDWVCACRLPFDVEAEKDDDEDEDEDEDAPYVDPCGEKCIEPELASHHPDHKWVTTLRGADRKAFWRQEEAKRDQEEFDKHIYNDFSGYGQIEVAKNQIAAFDKAYKNGKGELLAVWAELEGMAFWLNLDLYPMMTCDDSDGISALIAMIGHATLKTIALAIEKNEFKKESSIKNLGLILSLLLHFVTKQWTGFGGNPEEGWIENVVALADKHKIELDILHGFEETIDEIRNDMRSESETKGEFGGPKDTGRPWTSVLKKFTADHGVAPKGKGKPRLEGDSYDITKQ